jgi:hypothetical protein
MVLMLTAAADVQDRVVGLGLGADTTWVSRSRSRSWCCGAGVGAARAGACAAPGAEGSGGGHGAAAGDAGRAGDRVDGEGVRDAVCVAGRAWRPGHEQLLERVWDEFADPFTNTVRVTVNRLRRRLGDPQLVETVVGVGYVIR